MNRKALRFLSSASAVALTATLAPSAIADEELATREYIVSEFVQSVGRNTMQKSDYILSTFTDNADISEEYRADMSKAVNSGILRGYDDKTLRPKETVSRIESLVMLARALSSVELEAKQDAIVFTDVPDWAKEDIDKLSAAGLVNGYGDGTLGATDNITIEQVGLLTDRSDELLNTVTPGESFYGYANNKLFRNADTSNISKIDAIHGAVETSMGSWSPWNDYSYQIDDQEAEMIKKLVNGEYTYEAGTPEQRIYDMLKCVQAGTASDEDNAKVKEYMDSVYNATTIDELDAACDKIYKETGIATLYKVEADFDGNHTVVPRIDLNDIGLGGMIGFATSTNTKAYKETYRDIMKEELTALGYSFTGDEITNAITLQGLTGKTTDYGTQYYNVITMIGSYFPDIIDADKADKFIADIKALHPDMVSEDGTFKGLEFQALAPDKCKTLFSGVDVDADIKALGYTDYDDILVAPSKYINLQKDVVTENNLRSLKANVLLELGKNLCIYSNEDFNKATRKEDTMQSLMLILSDIDDIKESMTYIDEDAIDPDYIEEGETADDAVDDLTDAYYLDTVRGLLPNDIGLMWCKYYYDDKYSDAVSDMVDQIWAAYLARFDKNEWMDESTKAAAKAKIDNMIAVIGYPDNYTYPTIISPDDGGTILNNTININLNDLAENIRLVQDQTYVRAHLWDDIDAVNACYVATFNDISIPAGIIGGKFYDPNRSYAANLGAIGTVIGHEIGHAFDNYGSQFDEIGRKVDWFTEDDKVEYNALVENFVDYYSDWEVTWDGTTQDSSVTIGENMADFAGMTCVMDILRDDPEGQKEALLAYAQMWGQLGTHDYLTNSVFMTDEHSSNSVRVNAIVSSLDQFYDLFEINEDDYMYVAPEGRLKLW